MNQRPAAGTFSKEKPLAPARSGTLAVPGAGTFTRLLGGTALGLRPPPTPFRLLGVGVNLPAPWSLPTPGGDGGTAGAQESDMGRWLILRVCLARPRHPDI